MAPTELQPSYIRAETFHVSHTIRRPELGATDANTTVREVSYLPLHILSRNTGNAEVRWIRNQQAKLLSQARETPRKYVERGSHYLWGRRYLLSVIVKDEKPIVILDHRRIRLYVRPGSTLAKREEVMNVWHRALLHEVVPSLIRKWEAKLGVKVSGYFLQRMKTKWGGCNHRAGNIRLNTELVKKPKDLPVGRSNSPTSGHLKFLHPMTA